MMTTFFPSNCWRQDFAEGVNASSKPCVGVRVETVAGVDDRCARVAADQKPGTPER